MNQRTLRRLKDDLPKLLKALREGQYFVLAESWLAQTELVGLHSLAITNADARGQSVMTLLRWVISLLPSSDADSVTLLHCFYLQRQTVENVAERLSISSAAFYKVRQPKALSALARRLAQLFVGKPQRYEAWLQRVIEDRYVALSEDAQKAMRFLALLRKPVAWHWVQQCLGLSQMDGVQLQTELLATHCFVLPANNNQAPTATPELQAYWHSHSQKAEALAWHNLAHDYFYAHGHLAEAAHHQLEQHAHERAAQLLIEQQTKFLELPDSKESQEFLTVLVRIQQNELLATTWAALKMAEGKTAQRMGNTEQALAAFRITLALPAAEPLGLKAEACYRYANALETQDIDGALAHYQRAIELFEASAPGHVLHMRAYIDLVWICLQMRTDLEKAEQALADADMLFARYHAQHFTLKADLHNAWARYFHLRGDAAGGIAQRHQALLAANESGDPDRIMKLSHNLGQDYREAKQYSLALTYLKESLALACKMGNRLSEGMNLETIGGCYFFLQDYPAAIACYYQAYELFVAIGNWVEQGWAALDLYEAYLQLGELDSARKFYIETDRIANQLGLARLAEALAGLALGRETLSRPEVKRLQRRAQTIAYVQQHGAISNRAYRTLTGISPKHATRDLAIWVQDGTFKVSGKGRSVLYQLSTHSVSR